MQLQENKRSIEQLKLRQITLSEEEYKQLLNRIKNTFTNVINQKMDTIEFEHLDVEDRLQSCLRAEQSGDKLRRVIDLKRQNAQHTVYTRWTPQEATQNLLTKQTHNILVYLSKKTETKQSVRYLPLDRYYNFHCLS